MTTSTPITTCPTFHDLRAFAAGAVAGPDPFGAGRRALPLRPGPVEAGAIVLAAGSGAAVADGADLWLHALTGAVDLTSEAGAIHLAEGASCVVASGTALRWRAEADATLVYMRAAAAPGAAALDPIDPTAELAPSGAPLAELLIGETPACRNATQFRSADGVFTAGVWDSTPYHRRAMCYGHHELMVLRAGSVTFVDEAGRAGTFRQGDAFLIERGASCSWESREHVTKLWAIHRPLA